MWLRWAPILLTSCGIFSACGVTLERMPAAVDCRTISTRNIDDCVRLNQIQTLGTHNSYHVAPPPPLLSMLGEAARDIEYSHRPLTEQLSVLGIRKLELDVFADPDGGRFRRPAGLRMVEGLDPIDPALSKPGFKVLHTPGIGDISTPVFAAMLLLQAVRMRLPFVVQARMVLNAAIDMLVGLVPVLGDLVDIGWKANLRNLALLERHARPGVAPRRGDYTFVVICVVVLALIAITPVVLLVWLLSRFSLW